MPSIPCGGGMIPSGGGGPGGGVQGAGLLPRGEHGARDDQCVEAPGSGPRVGGAHASPPTAAGGEVLGHPQ